MTYEFNIKRATLKDLPDALSVLDEARQWQVSKNRENAWSKSWISQTKIKNHILANALYIAWKDKRAVATLGLHNEDIEGLWADCPSNNAGYIGRLSVRREVSGSGAANILYKNLEKSAIEKGLEFLRADIYKSEVILGKWCLRKGFKSFGCVETPAGNQVLRFQKKL